MHSTQRWLSQDTVLLAGHNLPGTSRKSWPTPAGCNLGNYPVRGSEPSSVALVLVVVLVQANPLMPFIMEGAGTSEMHAEYNASWLISGQNNIKLKQIEHKKHSRIRQTPQRGAERKGGEGAACG